MRVVPFVARASQAAEKVDSEQVLVTQALLPVRFLLDLTRAHRQECLCYTTFSAGWSPRHKRHNLPADFANLRRSVL